MFFKLNIEIFLKVQMPTIMADYYEAQNDISNAIIYKKSC